MSLRSVWTRQAEVSFHTILAYLQAEWGGVVAEAFAADVSHTILLLELFPGGGVLEVKDKGIRSIPVARQVRMFYRTSESEVVILEFIDTRTERFQAIRE